MVDIYTLKSEEEILVYLGHFDTPTGLEWGLCKCLVCEKTSVLSREEIKNLKYQIKISNIKGKVGNETLTDEVIEEIQNLDRGESSRELTKRVDKLLTSLN